MQKLQEQMMLKLSKQQLSLREIGEKVGLSHQSVSNFLKPKGLVAEAEKKNINHEKVKQFYLKSGSQIKTVIKFNITKQYVFYIINGKQHYTDKKLKARSRAVVKERVRERTRA